VTSVVAWVIRCTVNAIACIAEGDMCGAWLYSNEAQHACGGCPLGQRPPSLGYE
jgi:hypothetical protein